jgi:hypothetical protein
MRLSSRIVVLAMGAYGAGGCASSEPAPPTTKPLPDAMTTDASFDERSGEDATGSMREERGAPDDAAACDATAPLPRIIWLSGFARDDQPCGTTTCSNDRRICIPACFARRRTDPVPCGERICQPDELCEYGVGGSDSGNQPVGGCVPGPERECAPGADCCFRGCSPGMALEVTIDLENRVMFCGNP